MCDSQLCGSGLGKPRGTVCSCVLIPPVLSVSAFSALAPMWEPVPDGTMGAEEVGTHREQGRVWQGSDMGRTREDREITLISRLEYPHPSSCPSWMPDMLMHTRKLFTGTAKEAVVR